VRPAILLSSWLGALLFGAAFVLSWSHPLLVERAAREVIRIEVERRVGQRIDELSDTRIAGFARRALRATRLEIEHRKRDIREQLPRRVANLVADMMDADCECRRRLVAHSEAAAHGRLASLAGVEQRLTGLIEASYASVRRGLLREFRIFTGSNAAAFALLGLTTLVRRKAGLQLFLPVLVLVGAVAVTGSLYLFNQDWLHTIVFGEYVGFGYALYLAVVAASLADIAFNRARVSTGIVNAALQAVGSAASAVPC
jgi:hypothetical protein